MSEVPLRILQLGTHDIGGGAERVAWLLQQGYRERGHDAWLAVGYKHSKSPYVLEIERAGPPALWRRSLLSIRYRLRSVEKYWPVITKSRRWLQVMANGRSSIERELGREDFHYPASRRVLTLLPTQPQVVHGHNLHGSYFDLRYLPILSNRVPVLLTLHDAWLLSGHCAHSFDCERWRIGCGHCPDLTIPPNLGRDGTANNWRRKADIYSRARLYVATPCKWLMDRVGGSMLAPAIYDARVIPNGVDKSVFCLGDKLEARTELDLPIDATILLFAANGIRHNSWKDFQTMRSALAQLGENTIDQKIVFVALGENAPPEQIGRTEIRFVTFQGESNRVAKFYQAADVYLHAARADTFPNTILEALACGTPVVATSVGGIPEQVEDGVTGFLSRPGDSRDMANAVLRILNDNGLRENMRRNAADDAARRFDLNRQVDEYLAWYRAAIDRWPDTIR